jgi:predicted metalloendopeptidase
MFPAEAKAKAEKMKTSLLLLKIESITCWMSPETKVSAVENYMSKIKIGYPDKWKDYSA